MTTVIEQLDTLAEVLGQVQGRIPADVEAATRNLLAHASRRLAAGPQTTVALAGATGSGKSSLFNALSGTRLAEQGARRPTTSQTLAVSFSATGRGRSRWVTDRSPASRRTAKCPASRSVARTSQSAAS